MNSAEVDLQLATKWMSAISLFLFIPLGLFGCFCNIIIFTSKKLRNNSCSFYFLCTAFFETFILCFGGISRLATEFFGSTFINQNHVMCKIRSYLITMSTSVATYLLLMTSIDRCMTTSIHVRYRSFSQLKIAYRMVFLIILFTMLCNIPVLIFFDLLPTCTPAPGIYAMSYSIYVIFWIGLLPDALLLLFTLRTFQNTKHLGSRMAASTVRQRIKHKMERQFLLMLISQALVSVFVDCTRMSCYGYYFLKFNSLTTVYNQLVAVFIFQLSNVLLYLNYSKSFYIYTLASSLFRKHFHDFIHNCYDKIISLIHTNQIHPINTILNSNNNTSAPSSSAPIENP